MSAVATAFHSAQRAVETAPRSGGADSHLAEARGQGEPLHAEDAGSVCYFRFRRIRLRGRPRRARIRALPPRRQGSPALTDRGRRPIPDACDHPALAHPVAPQPWLYTHRFIEAVQVALLMHANQPRKGTTIPYASHLLGTCSIALDYAPSGVRWRPTRPPRGGSPRRGSASFPPLPVLRGRAGVGANLSHKIIVRV